MASGSESAVITLRSSDGDVFEVEKAVALQMGTIKNMIDDGCAEGTIPLLNVTGPILAKVIEYCRKHAEFDRPPELPGLSDDEKAELKAWDKEFVRGVDRESLFHIILAANFLAHPELLDLSCQGVADMIQNMSLEEVRELFNIENDFTPEEEEKLRNEHAWAFE